MMFKRFRSQPHHHRHGHSHPHGAHTHTHHHDHTHDHHHEHPHEHQHHHHGNGGHSHIPDEMSWGGLIALGASGGLVPCESALVLLLGAIALGRVGLGLLLLLSFSAGLAIVLMAVGAIVLYAKNLLPERKHSKQGWVLRYVPIASAAAVTVIGIVMTGVSLGWIRSGWMIG
jgi:ABC-type nickel/cobalt efflux system permease component RcnA